MAYDEQFEFEVNDHVWYVDVHDNGYGSWCANCKLKDDFNQSLFIYGNEWDVYTSNTYADDLGPLVKFVKPIIKKKEEEEKNENKQ